MVAGAESCDAGADFGDDAGDFVPGNEGGADAASEGAVDDQEVVAAEAAGFDLDEGVGVAEGWVGEVCEGEVGVGAGLLKEEGFHGVGRIIDMPSLKQSGNQEGLFSELF